MHTHTRSLLRPAALAGALAALTLAATPSAGAQRQPSAHLKAFGSTAELTKYLDGLRATRRREAPQQMAVMDAAGAPPPMTAAPANSAARSSATSAADESVTNVQHAGVDEGGIVKTHGRHLVVLRRGRLFTVDVGDRALRPVSAVNAYGPGIDPANTWYDELLVHEDRVIVIGFSYARGGTELGLFRIDDRGRLRHEATYQMRSNDYYSARNYASRLVDGRLVLYAPLTLTGSHGPFGDMPAMRRWHPGTRREPAPFRPLVTAQRVFRAPSLPDDAGEVTLHSVTSCDLGDPVLQCSARVVIGPPAGTFYVSPTSVYVWVNRAERRRGIFASSATATLIRMPLGSELPSAVGVEGNPIDQFSFSERENGELDVLVRRQGGGAGMWESGRRGDGLALLRAPIEEFGDGTRSIEAVRYQRLPDLEAGALQNRFVGRHLLYGAGNGWDAPDDRGSAGSTLHVVALEGGSVHRVALTHAVDRIEVMGSDAVVVGSTASALEFSGVSLGRRPAVRQRYSLPGAAQGETRSHGFFYRGDASGGGTIGLPVRGPGESGARQLREGSASVLFVRNTGARFEPLGELEASGSGGHDDGCVASCVDWYGNARPLFIGERVFALLGGELVEGRVSGRAIRETARVTFVPRLIFGAR